MLKILLLFLVVLFSEQLVAQDPNPIPPPRPAGEPEKKEEVLPVPPKVVTPEPKRETAPPPTPVTPEKKDPPTPAPVAEKKQDPQPPPTEVPMPVQPPTPKEPPVTDAKPPVAVVPRARVAVTAKQIPISDMVKTDQLIVTEVPAPTPRNVTTKKIETGPLYLDMPDGSEWTKDHQVGIVEVYYEALTPESTGVVFKGKLQKERPFAPANKADYDKIREEVQTKIFMGKPSDKIYVDDYGSLHYEQYEFALTFHPPGQQRVAFDKKVRLARNIENNLRMQFLAQVGRLNIVPSYADFTKVGRAKVYFGVTLYDRDQVKSLTKEEQEEVGQRVHDYFSGKVLKGFGSDSNSVGTGNLGIKLADNDAKFYTIEFSYYTEDSGVAIPLADTAALAVNNHRRSLVKQIDIVEKERKANVAVALVSIAAANELFQKEKDILSGAVNSDVKKEDRKIGVEAQLARLNAANETLKAYAGFDPDSRKQMAVINDLAKSGNVLLDRLTYPLVVALPEACGNFQVQQEARDRTVIYQKREDKLVQISYIGSLREKSFVCQGDLALAVVDPMKAPPTVPLPKPSMQLTATISDDDVDPVGGTGALLLGIKGGTIVYGKHLSETYKGIEIGAISPTDSGFRFVNPATPDQRTEISSDGKRIRHRKLAPDTWKTYAFFVTQQGTQIVYITPENKEVVLALVLNLDLKRIVYNDGLLTFVTKGLAAAPGDTLKGAGVAKLEELKNREAVFILKGDSLGIPTTSDDEQQLIGDIALNSEKTKVTINFKDNTIYQMAVDIDGNNVKRNMILSQSCQGKNYSVDMKSGKELGKSEISFGGSGVVATAVRLKQMECNDNAVTILASTFTASKEGKDEARLDPSSNATLNGAEAADGVDKVVVMNGNKAVHVYKPLKNMRVTKIRSLPEAGAGFEVQATVQPLDDFAFRLSNDGKIAAKTMQTNGKGVLKIIQATDIGKEPGKEGVRHYLVAKDEIIAQIYNRVQIHGNDTKVYILAPKVRWLKDKVKLNLVKNDLSVEVEEKTDTLESDTPYLLAFEDNNLRAAMLSVDAKDKKGFTGFNLSGNNLLLWTDGNTDYVDVLSLLNYKTSGQGFSRMEAVDPIVLK